MPYKGFETPWNSYDEARDVVFQFMQDVGWTLYDDIDADTKVFTTSGTLGYLPAYMHFYKSTTTLYFDNYLYWDKNTHTGGTEKAYTYSSFHNAFTGAPATICCYGNEDYVTLNMFTSGFPRLFNNTLATLTASGVAGDSVVITVNSTEGFQKGSHYQIVGAHEEGRDSVYCQAVIDSTSLELVNLPRNYDPDARIGFAPMPYCASTSNLRYNWYPLCHNNAVGKAYTSTLSWLRVVMIPGAYVDPSSRNDKHILMPVILSESASSHIGYFTDNILQPPSETLNYVYGISDNPNGMESGYVTSATASGLVDNTKTWGADEWKDKFVIIGDGTGIKQTRKISSNTISGALSIHVDWFTTPDITSLYYIVDEVFINRSTNYVVREIIE